MSYCYDYPRPALAVDCVVFTIDQAQLQVLLIQRLGDPFQGQWALPGGFVDIDETTDQAAKRELQEETGLDQVFLEQLYTFSAVERDPRARVISVAYFALVKFSEQQVQADSDASDARWFAVNQLPNLAFDHAEIMRLALERLRGKVRYQPIGFELLPEKFTLTQLQQLYEILLETNLDKRNFRKKILSMGLLKELDEFQSDVSHRAAKLYKFDETKYRRLLKSGFDYWI